MLKKGSLSKNLSKKSTKIGKIEKKIVVLRSVNNIIFDNIGVISYNLTFSQVKRIFEHYVKGLKPIMAYPPNKFVAKYLTESESRRRNSQNLVYSGSKIVVFVFSSVFKTAIRMVQLLIEPDSRIAAHQNLSKNLSFTMNNLDESIRLALMNVPKRMGVITPGSKINGTIQVNGEVGVSINFPSVIDQLRKAPLLVEISSKRIGVYGFKRSIANYLSFVRLSKRRVVEKQSPQYTAFPVFDGLDACVSNNRVVKLPA